MIQNSKEPLGFVHPEISCRGIQKMRTFNAVECRYINDLQQKSTLRGATSAVYDRGFHKNILGFSKKRKEKL